MSTVIRGILSLLNTKMCQACGWKSIDDDDKDILEKPVVGCLNWIYLFNKGAPGKQQYLSKEFMV